MEGTKGRKTSVDRPHGKRPLGKVIQKWGHNIKVNLNTPVFRTHLVQQWPTR